jgi:hypothetical protein
VLDGGTYEAIQEDESKHVEYSVPPIVPVDLGTACRRG